MTKEELLEQLKYSSSEWLYVVTWNNILRQVFCPFRVAVIKSVGMLKKGDVVWVQQVKVTMELVTVFMIEDKAYYYYHFEIILE